MYKIYRANSKRLLLDVLVYFFTVLIISVHSYIYKKYFLFSIYKMNYYLACIAFLMVVLYLTIQYNQTSIMTTPSATTPNATTNVTTPSYTTPSYTTPSYTPSTNIVFSTKSGMYSYPSYTSLDLIDSPTEDFTKYTPDQIIQYIKTTKRNYTVPSCFAVYIQYRQGYPPRYTIRYSYTSKFTDLNTVPVSGSSYNTSSVNGLKYTTQTSITPQPLYYYIINY